MDKYQSEIIKANDAFAHENMSVVKVVYTDRRHFPREALSLCVRGHKMW